MKKTIFLMAAITFTLTVHAQLILNSNNQLFFGTTNAPSLDYQMNFQTKSFLLTNGSNALLIDMWGTTPRISGNGDRVEFLNRQRLKYNSIAVSEVFSYSDERAKTDISPINNGMETLLSLNPVTYRWKDTEAAQSRSAMTATGEKQYGFLAQEIESVLPGAVMTDEDGRKLVNYSAVIPVMVEAIQTLQAQIAELTATPMETRSAQGLDETGAEAIELSQNVPNPFNVSTDIHFTIPQAVRQARLFIYNLQGNQLKNLPIDDRGKGKITIKANELTPGMYIYALVADGKEVANKRMILTD